ncbi:MAG: recombinase family protein [Actinomycetota bacterium]|nr:recombinase family protein [Rubrobacteraceae bacterium]MDQ3182639.1 recombinase family protein [Actinomycetota bacterium]
MRSSELVTAEHLARKAVIYVRQSTPNQVLTNRESLGLQYALNKRATELGWRADDVEVIDSDLGFTGSEASHRECFKELTAMVTLGRVGIVLSSEVTRLSRNCSDWYPLLDICGYKGCLIADHDGVYDPATVNGRLVLGIKGTLSEMELHTISSRMRAGILSKAERGELGLKLPTGLARDEHGLVHKDPNLEVQDRICLVFESFLRLRSANKVLLFFNEDGLLVPRLDRFGDVVWKRPTIETITSILKNPAYAGAFVYGRNSHTTKRGPNGNVVKSKRLPMEKWRILIKDKYPAYVDWETFERIQAMLKDNHAEYERNMTRGVPREGKALLAGLVYCGECSHKMTVRYSGASRYLCAFFHQQYGDPFCQNLPAGPVDAWVVEAFLEALSPVELDLYEKAMAAREEMAAAAEHARRQQLQRLSYQAELARRRFERADPDNRLVAAELERRWEGALRELRQAEEDENAGRYTGERKNGSTPAELTAELKAAFRDVGRRLPEIWDKDLLSQKQRKALVRCLIEKVVLRRIAPDTIQARIAWKGGQSTTFEVPTTVGAFFDLSGAEEMERLVVKLFKEGNTDRQIARRLTEMGHRSPQRKHVLPSTVQTIRHRHGLIRGGRVKGASRAHHVPGRLTLSQVARKLEVPKPWMYNRIYNGAIQVVKDDRTGLYLFPDDPTTIERFRELKEGKIRKLRF